VSRAFVIAGAAACVAAVLVHGVGAAPDASRIVDRTFSCEAGFVGGLFQVDLDSRYSTTPGSSKLRVSSAVTQNIHVAALGHMSSDGIRIHRGLCLPARGTVKLTTKGLRGGAVPPLGTESTCETPRRLLLRVRAVFTRPVTLYTSRQYGFPLLIAAGDVEQAALAVATRTGKAIAYLTVTGTEEARLYTSKTCEED